MAVVRCNHCDRFVDDSEVDEQDICEDCQYIVEDPEGYEKEEAEKQKRIDEALIELRTERQNNEK